MTPPEIRLTETLRSNAKLREKAEELIAAYIELGPTAGPP